jgi:CDP-glucose 4,6-dehydratase
VTASAAARPALDEGPLREAFAGRRVLLTGHTGFKGGWTALWLRRLGARVVGVALPPPSGPSFCAAVGLEDLVDSRRADIRDAAAYGAAVADVDAELVVHMAAQALVRPSYADVVGTVATNVLGTAVVLDAARRMPSLRALIVVTSDKCYENLERDAPYREDDRLGGSDPYSASKACAEIVAESWRRSFLSGPGAPALATVRAGNVLGGGDWAEDRLVPDILRAAARGAPVRLRSPASLRPWQHVLDPVHGYLALAAALLTRGAAFAGPWNFGPDPDAALTVGAVARLFAEAVGAPAPVLAEDADAPREARLLQLDSAKARARLGWRPRLDIRAAAAATAAWHRAHRGGADMRAVSAEQIDQFVTGATAAEARADARVHQGAPRCA